MPIMSTRSTGMRNLLTFSMPFSTPKKTTRAVRSTYITKNAVGSPRSPMKCSKKVRFVPGSDVAYEATEASLPPPVIKTVIYLSTQPPITQ